MKTTNEAQSAGLAFMLAAATGIAKSIGDRQRSAALNEFLMSAIRLKMAFNPDDANLLNALRMRTCVGVFRPFDEHFYTQSCISGGTFARMWEKAQSVKPFKAVLAGQFGEIQSNIRVATGVAVLLDGKDDDEMMPRSDDLQVWWVTSVDWNGDCINLSRYRLRPDARYPFSRNDAPARRLKLSRTEWVAQMAAVASAKQISSQAA